MSVIEINDILEELKDNNTRLYELVKRYVYVFKLLDQFKCQIIDCVNQCHECQTNERIGQLIHQYDNIVNDVKTCNKLIAISGKCQTFGGQQQSGDKSIRKKDNFVNLDRLVFNHIDGNSECDLKTIGQNIESHVDLDFNVEIKQTKRQKRNSLKKSIDINCDEEVEEDIEVKKRKKKSNDDSDYDFEEDSKQIKRNNRSRSTKHIKKTICCEFCIYTTNKRSRLTNHINYHHLNIRPFECTICGKRLLTQKTLDEHMKNVHTSEDTYYTCIWSNCSFKTKYKDTFEGHIMRHKGDTTFQCLWPGCGNILATQSILISHMEKVHENKERYECPHPDCDYKAATKQSLKLHSVVHCDDRLYPCQWPGCDKSFKLSYSLKSHEKTHINDKQQACDWPDCGQKFLTLTNLKLHMKRHNGQKDYVCPYKGCGKAFVDKGHMIRHKKIHIKKLNTTNHSTETTIQIDSTIA